MNESIKNMIERRSVRKYKNKQIIEEQLAEILEAGRYSASGMGRQPVKMVVIQDKSVIAQLSKMNADIMGSSTDPFYGAPTVIVVLADSSVSTYTDDGALVMGNLMNAAHAVGVDSCWIHRAKEEFDSAEGRALLEKWNISSNYKGIAHCILGYGDGEYPASKPRKEDTIIRI